MMFLEPLKHLRDIFAPKRKTIGVNAERDGFFGFNLLDLHPISLFQFFDMPLGGFILQAGVEENIGCFPVTTKAFHHVDEDVTIPPAGNGAQDVLIPREFRHHFDENGLEVHAQRISPLSQNAPRIRTIVNRDKISIFHKGSYFIVTLDKFPRRSPAKNRSPWMIFWVATQSTSS